MSSKGVFYMVVVTIVIPFLYRYGVKIQNEHFVDLPSFYFASNASFNENFSPYDFERLKETYTPESKLFPYLYPPPSLLFFYHYSFVTYELAKVITLLANHLYLFLSLYLLLFRILDLRYSNNLVYLLLIYVFSFQPLYLTLIHGQVNLELLLFISIFWLLFKKKEKDYLTAIPLALAILLKTYPGLFLVFLLIKGKYDLIRWTFLYMGLAAVLSVVVLPANTWHDWLADVMPTGGVGEVSFNLFNPAAPWNQSINGFVSRLFMPNDFSNAIFESESLAKLTGYLLNLTVFAIMIYAFIRSRKNKNLQEDTEISIVLLSMYLLAPLSWEHHLVYLIPCIALLFKDRLTRKSLDYKFFVLIGLTTIISWDLPLESPFLKRGILILIISAKFYCVSIIWVYFISKLWSSKGLAAVQAISTRRKKVKADDIHKHE